MAEFTLRLIALRALANARIGITDFTNLRIRCNMDGSGVSSRGIYCPFVEDVNHSTRYKEGVFPTDFGPFLGYRIFEVAVDP
jgi:hypothetical protein